MLKSTDKEGKEILHGILGMHVDDGIGGGDKAFPAETAFWSFQDPSIQICWH
jgi:hypothetical protein